MCDDQAMRKVFAGALLVVVCAAAGCGGGHSSSPGTRAAGSSGTNGTTGTHGPTGANGYDGSRDAAKVVIASKTPMVGSSTKANALGGPMSGAGDIATLLKGIPQNGLVLGNPNAPVTLIEYIDLQCPICQEFESTQFAPLVEKYVRPGKLKIKLQPWSILDRTPDEHDSDRGQKATIAAAAQNKAFNFAQVLYDNQGVEATGWMNDAEISNIAASVDGLNTRKLAKDANSAATRRVIASITNWANSHPSQMTGTPTLYLAKGNGAPQYLGTGIPDLTQLEAAINDASK